MLTPGRSATRVHLVRHRDGRGRRRRDVVATEEPLEIRVAWEEEGVPRVRPVSVTMRTPGHDFELAVGFLFTEGVLDGRETVRELVHCDGVGADADNVVRLTLRPGHRLDPSLLDRNFYATSSCGVCGKASLEALEIRSCPRPAAGRPTVAASVLAGLPERLAESQAVFRRTGGLHAAGLFRPDGGLELVREDVGRHNAVDKVIGRSLLDGEVPLESSILVVSGRVSFEIVQKALAGGIGVVAAVGAPSSLAVETARRFGMTLAGFVRGGGFNLYAGEERVRTPDRP